MKSMATSMLVAVMALSAAIAGAATLSVDFSVSDTPSVGGSANDVESGFYDFSVPSDTINNVPPVTRTIATTLGIAGTVDVVVSGVTQDCFWRDRDAEKTGALGDLAEEFAACGTDLALTFSDLRAGFYSVTTYHHDQVFTTPAYPAHTSVGIASITVTSGGGTSTVVTNDIVSAGQTEPPNAATFQFSANGVDDVVVTFKDRVGGNPVLNGFVLEEIIPDTVKVDFSVSDIPSVGGSVNDVENGFFDFSTPSDVINSVPPVTNTIATTLGTGDTVRVVVSGANVFWRDRDAEKSGPLGALAEEFAASVNGTDLALTLLDLRTGFYTMTTYHHDQTFTTPVWPADTSVGIDLIVVQNGGGATTVVTDDIVSAGQTEPPNSATFQFSANGVDGVVVTFKDRVGGNPVLNGFELAEAPAPPVPDDIKVDLSVSDIPDAGLSANDLESGFFNFAVPSDVVNNVPPVTNTIATTLGTDDTVRAVVYGVTQDCFWRDRDTEKTGALGDLAEEFAACGTDLALAISGLRPGLYSMTTYHHDQFYTTPDYPAHTSVGIDSITVTSGGVTTTVVTDDIVSAGRTEPPNSATFQFSVNGVDDVVVTFEDRAGGNPVLNGFTVDVVEFVIPGSVVIIR